MVVEGRKNPYNNRAYGHTRKPQGVYLDLRNHRQIVILTITPVHAELIGY